MNNQCSKNFAKTTSWIVPQKSHIEFWVLNCLVNNLFLAQDPVFLAQQLRKWWVKKWQAKLVNMNLNQIANK